MPSSARQHLAEGLGAGAATQAGGTIGDAARDAFLYALNDGLRIGALVALAGAALAWMLIAPKEQLAAPAQAEPIPEPIASAEAAA
jgi:hypothetical protein